MSARMPQRSDRDGRLNTNIFQIRAYRSQWPTGFLLKSIALTSECKDKDLIRVLALFLVISLQSFRFSHWPLLPFWMMC